MTLFLLLALVPTAPPQFEVTNKCSPAPAFTVVNRCAAPGVVKTTPRPFPQSPATRATSAHVAGQASTLSVVPDPFRAPTPTPALSAAQFGGTSGCANGQCGTTQTFFPRRR